MPAAAGDDLGSNTSITNSPIAEKFVSVGAILNKVDFLQRENLISGGALASKICQDAGLNEGWLDARLALATAGADLAVANLQLSELFTTKRLGQLLRPLEKMAKSRTKSERERALGGLLKIEEYLDAVNAFGQKDVAGGVPPLRDVSFDRRVLATERNATTNPFNSIGVRLAEVVLAIDARLDKETKRELLRLPDAPPVESPMYQKIRVELDLELARRTRETPALREGAAEREGVHRMAKLADLAMSVYGSKEAVQNYEAGRNYAPVHSEEDHLRDTYPKDVAKITPEWRAALRTALVANGMPSLCNFDVLERILFRDKPGSGRAGSAVRSVPKLLIRLSEHLEAREGSWADPDVGVIAGVLATSTATKLVREKIDKAQSAFEMALSDQKEITSGEDLSSLLEKMSVDTLPFLLGGYSKGITALEGCGKEVFGEAWNDPCLYAMQLQLFARNIKGSGLINGPALEDVFRQLFDAVSNGSAEEVSKGALKVLLVDPAPVPKWAQEKFFEAGEHRELTELEHAMLAVAFDLQPTRAGNRIRSLVASEYLPEQTPKLKRDLLDMHERLVEKFSVMECTSWYNDAKISLLRDLARASEMVAGVTDGIRGTRQILLEEEIPNLRELKVGMLFLDREREKLFKINEIRIGGRVEGTVLGSVTFSSVWETSPGRFSNNGVKIALNSPRFRDLVRECEEVTGKRNPGEPMNRLLKRLLGSAQEQ